MNPKSSILTPYHPPNHTSQQFSFPLDNQATRFHQQLHQKACHEDGDFCLLSLKSIKFVQQHEHQYSVLHVVVTVSCGKLKPLI